MKFKTLTNQCLGVGGAIRTGKSSYKSEIIKLHSEWSETAKRPERSLKSCVVGSVVRVSQPGDHMYIPDPVRISMMTTHTKWLHFLHPISNIVYSKCRHVLKSAI